ncbi:hypothetical protein OOV28_001444 [Campylobacter jejuni]|nr:hypothetical protein [Campylobacter jejuni]EJD0663891.1 hypothetical protein [Campylobacter jejuni]EKB9597833.1 hypothetical protein [Campylobacter jejuni]
MLECIQFIKEIAKDLYNSEFIRILVGCIAFYFTFSQLRYAKRNMLLNIAKNEIDIFNKLDERQKLFIECQIKFSNIKNNDNDEEMKILLNEEERLKKYYFDLLDTVCFYAINNNITAKNFYSQYKNILLAVNELYEDTIKEYENICKVIKIIENDKTI